MHFTFLPFASSPRKTAAAAALAETNASQQSIKSPLCLHRMHPIHAPSKLSAFTFRRCPTPSHSAIDLRPLSFILPEASSSVRFALSYVSLLL